MRARIDLRHLERLHRSEYREAHREVQRLLARGPRRPEECWDLGRLFKRITDAHLYTAAGHRSFKEYLEALGKKEPWATTYKAITVFPRDVAAEFGVTLLAAVWWYWKARPGTEDPAHVRAFRFPIVVRGRLEEHVLGDRALTVARLLDATARLKRERARQDSPLADFCARFVDLVERRMRVAPAFEVRTRAARSGPYFVFSGVSHEHVERFWRAQGTALARIGRLSARERALVRAADRAAGRAGYRAPRRPI